MKRSKHGLFVFPPFVLQYDVKAKYRLISRKFSGMKFFHRSASLTNHRPRAFVSVRQTTEIALFPFVCCFCFVRAFSFQVHTKIGSNMQCSGKWKSENSSSVVNCTSNGVFIMLFVTRKSQKLRKVLAKRLWQRVSTI